MQSSSAGARRSESEAQAIALSLIGCRNGVQLGTLARVRTAPAGDQGRIGDGSVEASRSLLIGTPICDHFFFGLASLDFRNRTPGPPPFSSMNSIPAGLGAVQGRGQLQIR